MRWCRLGVFERCFGDGHAASFDRIEQALELFFCEAAFTADGDVRAHGLRAEMAEPDGGARQRVVGEADFELGLLAALDDAGMADEGLHNGRRGGRRRGCGCAEGV